MMPGFLVEEGRYRKSGNCSDIAYFTYFFIDGPRDVFVYMNDIEIFSSNFFGRKCIMSEDGTTNYHIEPHRPKTAPHCT